MVKNGISRQDLTKFLAPYLAGFVIYIISPVPDGLSAHSYGYLILFVSSIIALAIEAIPSAAIGLFSVAMADILNLTITNPDMSDKAMAKSSFAWAVSGFTNGVVWLIFIAFILATGYKKTGLGERLTYFLLKKFGKSTLGLGYAVSIIDLILAPFMPSNAARSGGTVFPIVSSIPPMYDSYPDKNPRAIGSYIQWVCIAGCCVTSSMFITSLAPSVLFVSLADKVVNVQLDWGFWFKSVALFTIPLWLLVPILTYFIYPPTIKHSPDVPKVAEKKLKEMGPISSREILMIFFAVAALISWIFLGKYVYSASAGIIIVSCMVLLNVITWDDILSNKGAFNTFIWFATLVALAIGLKKTGVLVWGVSLVEPMLHGLSPSTVVVTLLLVWYFIHYFFASWTAQVAALGPIMMGLGAKILPPELLMPFIMSLGAVIGISGVITPYGTGHSPIWYGFGYIKAATWWGLGFIFTLIFLGGFFLLGYPVIF